jgi:hypothetical protein
VTPHSSMNQFHLSIEGLTTSPEDLRQSQRRPLRAPAMVLVQGKPGMLGRTIDVSEGGLCLALKDTITAGTECLVSFELPDKSTGRRRLQSQARVMYSILSGQHDGFKIGIKLLSPAPDLVHALHAFVRE